MSAPITHTKPLSRPAGLRALLQSPELEFLLEAHNGISARIVEQANFKGIWASGLALSAQYGVRDNNEASWTQIVEMLEFMSDVTAIPILLDGDTGYGNFNNMRRLVKKLEQRGIAGVCIEDKVFPKTNSFISGERQPLADMDEFCGKIKAGKDSQLDPDFCVIARVEALIAGWGLDEALRRAEAYHRAGADAILIHSKLSKPDEILAFAKEWGGRLPVVIVPTKYYSTPTDVFRKADISLVIWANHMIRAAVAAMEDIARKISTTQTLVDIEDRVSPVETLFKLQGADELGQAEQRYFKHIRGNTQVVILAASRGQGLESLTKERPKVMLPIGGKPLLRRLVDEFKRQEIHNITVIGGYRADAIDISGIHVITNPHHEDSDELATLACAQDTFSDDMIVIYGDLLFRSYILRDLMDSDGDITVVIDSALADSYISGTPDYAYCSKPDDRSLFGQDVNLIKISTTEKGSDAPNGRWIGLLRAQRQGQQWLNATLTALQAREDFNELGIPDLLNELVTRGHPIKVLYINGHWLDVNNLEDLDRAGDFTHGQTGYPISPESS